VTDEGRRLYLRVRASSRPGPRRGGAPPGADRLAGTVRSPCPPRRRRRSCSPAWATRWRSTRSSASSSSSPRPGGPGGRRPRSRRERRRAQGQHARGAQAGSPGGSSPPPRVSAAAGAPERPADLAGQSACASSRTGPRPSGASSTAGGAARRAVGGRLESDDSRVLGDAVYWLGIGCGRGWRWSGRLRGRLEHVLPAGTSPRAPSTRSSRPAASRRPVAASSSCSATSCSGSLNPGARPLLQARLAGAAARSAYALRMDANPGAGRAANASRRRSTRSPLPARAHPLTARSAPGWSSGTGAPCASPRRSRPT